MSIKSWISGAIATIRNIGPSIQGNNYGTGTVVGGTTYTQTGPSGTSGSSGGSSRGGGSGVIVSVPGERTGGRGGGGGSGSPPPTTTASLRGSGGAVSTGTTGTTTSTTIRQPTQAELRSKTETLSKEYASKIRVGAGPVETGRRKYYGEAVVPGTGGKTANELKQETFKEAKEKFGKDTKKGSYTAAFSQDYFVGEPSQTETKQIESVTLPSQSLSVYFPDTQRYGTTSPTQEFYNPKTGMYETTPSAYEQAGQGTTNIISSRLPTTKEQAKIDVMEGSPLFASTEKLKTDIKEIEKTTGKVNTLVAKISSRDKKISDLAKGKIDEKGQFTGTEQEYKTYSEEVNKRNQLYNQYESASQRVQARDRTLDFSFFGSKNPVKVSELSSKGLGLDIGTRYYDLTTKEIGKSYGDIYGRTIADIKVGKQAGAVMDLKTGAYRLATEKDYSTLGKNIVTPELVSKGVGGFYGAAKYAVPYVGATAYLSEKYVDINKSYGGKVGSWAKANPFEVALVGTAIVGFGAYKGGKFLTTPRVVETAKGFKVSSRAEDFLGKRVLVGGEKKLIQVKPSTRGRYVEVKKIEKPKADLEATEVIGFEKGDKVSFPEQKLKQTSFEGQRTEVYKIVKGKKVTLYEGVPYIAPEKYKAQFEYFKELVGEPQARKLLRYTAPKIEESIIKKGALTLKKRQATGRFDSTIEYPIRDVDKTLGIKTRGSRGIETKQTVQRTSLAQNKKIGVGTEESQSVLLNIRKEKDIIDLRGFAADKGISYTLTSGAKRISKKLDVSAETITGVSLKRNVPIDEVVSLETGKTTILKAISKEEQAGTVIKSGGKKSSQEYLTQLYAPKLKTAPIIKPSGKVRPEPQPVTVEEVKSSLIPKKEISGLPIGESSYAGTGLYEQTTVQTTSPTLLGITSQPVLVGVKGELMIKEKVGMKDKLEIKERLGLKESLMLKEKVVVGVKEKLGMKEMLKVKEKLGLREALVQGIRQAQVLKQAQKLQPIQRTLQRKGRLQEAKPKVKPKAIPKIKIPISEGGLLSRLSKQVDSGGFEIYQKIKGKEVKTGEAMGLSSAAKELGKGLKGGLQASGFLVEKRTGKKIKASKVVPLLGGEFRQSKVNLFGVVERKAKRLRKGGTGKQIQFFRKK